MATTRAERRAAHRAAAKSGSTATSATAPGASPAGRVGDYGMARNRAARGWMFTPLVDWLAVGGLSIVILLPLLASGRTDLVMIGAAAQAWLAAAINMPHFLASYRLVYGSKAMMLQHKWASMGIPGLLFAAIAAAIVLPPASELIGYGLVTISSLYLAWHYTGQAWGMMASFAYLGGTGFDAKERTLIKTSLRIMLTWHLAWFFYTQLRDPSRVEIIYRVVSAATVFAFAMGAYGLLRMRQRTGVNPPVLAVTAWFAIFVWYAVMARDPKAIFWVQIAHSVQYLSFPFRLEFNRAAGMGAAPGGAPGRLDAHAHAHDQAHRAEATGSRALVHMLVYGVVLMGVSIIVAQVAPPALMGVIGRIFGEAPGKATPILILMFINIHHYFTDGVLWKISNPEVRRDLFAHVAKA